MKNIHILPTDKPSNIYKTDRLYKYISGVVREPLNCINQHIYITNDEDPYPYALHLEKQEVLKVKGIGEDSGIIVHTKGFNYPHECKKIILTTDPDLIADNVQAIDDEFLEWFIKNPSCEWVEIANDLKYFNVDELRERHLKGLPHLYSESIGYKIIIPKEEPKPIHQQIIDLACGEERCKELLGIKPKQETLEEVAENEASIFYEKGTIEWNKYRQVFELGAKWQQEQNKNRYSEEEVLKLFHDYRIHFDLYRNIQVLPTMFSEWFEQFKKK